MGAGRVFFLSAIVGFGFAFGASGFRGFDALVNRSIAYVTQPAPVVADEVEDEETSCVPARFRRSHGRSTP